MEGSSNNDDGEGGEIVSLTSIRMKRYIIFA